MPALRFERHLPAWVKFAQFAVERENLTPEVARIRWVKRPLHWPSDVRHEDLDWVWPVATRPEVHLLEHQEVIPEDKWAWHSSGGRLEQPGYDGLTHGAPENDRSRRRRSSA